MSTAAESCGNARTDIAMLASPLISLESIQEERHKLIKAMFIVRDKGFKLKVINRYPIVDGKILIAQTFRKTNS